MLRHRRLGVYCDWSGLSLNCGSVSGGVALNCSSTVTLEPACTRLNELWIFCHFHMMPNTSIKCRKVCHRTDTSTYTSPYFDNDRVLATLQVAFVYMFFFYYFSLLCRIIQVGTHRIAARGRDIHLHTFESVEHRTSMTFALP